MPKPGSTAARGYGAEHKRTRQAAAVIVARGEATCSRCQRPIIPGTLWDLDHTADRTGYLGPAHRRCNRSAGGKNGAHIRNRNRRRRALTW